MKTKIELNIMELKLIHLKLKSKELIIISIINYFNLINNVAIESIS